MPVILTEKGRQTISFGQGASAAAADANHDNAQG
jgi:hypothetical protein